MKQLLKNLSLGGLLAVAGFGGALPAPAAEIVVFTNINVSTTWTSNNVYVLSNIVYVVDGATLTIEPGTVIRGKSDAETDGTFNPGALVITRGSKILALGSRNHPITFTDDDDNQVPGGAQTDVWTQKNNQWGGLVLLGRTYIAVGTGSGPDATKDNQIEGLTASTLGRYGPNGTTFLVDDDDDSGCIQYVSLRYGGNNLSAANEINGLTMGAVGRETDINYIEVLNNLDDGFEFFGGTVNCSHLITFAQGDDGVDYDEGFRGKLQFILNVKQDCNGGIESGFSDKSAEQNGGLSPDHSEPYAIPTIANVTYIGHGTNGHTAPVSSQRDTAHIFRANAGGRYYNSMFLDFGGGGVLIQQQFGNTTSNSTARSITAYTSYSPNAGAAFYPGPNEGMQLELKNNIWMGFDWDVNLFRLAPTNGSGFGGATVACTATNQFEAAYSNMVVSTLPIVDLTRGAAGRLNGPLLIDSFDPRPSSGSPALTQWRALPVDDFLVTVPYCGAFSPSNNWALGWTAIDALGLLASSTQPSAPEPMDITVVSLSQVDVDVPTENLVNYSIEASTDLFYWCYVGFVDGDGSVVLFTDLLPLESRLFYRAVVE